MPAPRWSTPVLTRLLTLLVAVPLLVPTVAASTASAADAADGAPPAVIRVCDRGGELIEAVPFDRYVKTVLPREFPPYWPVEALEAGALAVKSYAWYHVRHPWRDGCDISNTTRHQLYCPDCGNAPTARSNRAVDDTWHLRFDDAGRDDVAFAQYCSRCGGFPEGRHIDQYDAKAKAQAGWTAEELIAHFYRDMPARLSDWRTPFDLAVDGAGPYAFGEDRRLRLTAAVAARPGDDRLLGTLHATCTFEGTVGATQLDTSGVVAMEGRPSLVFDEASRVRGCAEDEVVLTVALTVNGYPAAERHVQAWRPWSSAADRDVGRLADTDDAVTAAVAISRRLFHDADAEDAAVDAAGPAVPAVSDEARGAATTAVLARSDRFADALAATPLAGTDGPILFTRGGPEAPLTPAVGEELERILAAGTTVHIVGGPAAVSEEAERDVAARGFEVRRHHGATRIETALAVAGHLRAADGDTSTVLVARAYPDTSAGWADAVAAGSYAAAQRHPVLLTGTAELDARTRNWLAVAIDRGDVDEVVLLGGPAAVPADAEAIRGADVSRISGASRDATAIAIIEALWSRDEAPGIEGALVIDAYGHRDWPFALASAVFGARMGTPQVVTHRLVPRATTGAWLDAHPGLPALVVGGDGVVRERIDEDVSGG